MGLSRVEKKGKALRSLANTQLTAARLLAVLPLLGGRRPITG
jgi:hypothetical protein